MAVLAAVLAAPDWHDGGVGIGGRRLALATALLAAACGDDAAPKVAADRAAEEASPVELLRADADGGRWTVLAHH